MQMTLYYLCPNIESMILIIELTIISVIYGHSSRTWNNLKNLKIIKEGKNFNIFKELKLDSAPEIVFNIECSSSDGENTTVSFRDTVKIPYTCWWAGTGDIDPNGLETASKTYVGTTKSKMTFVTFEYAFKEADEFTKGYLEQKKQELYEMNKNRDERCDVWLNIHVPSQDSTAINTFNKIQAFSSGGRGQEFSISSIKNTDKFALKPDSMKMPIICKRVFFWLFTILPLPFFNGALLRLIINTKYSYEVKKNIVRYVEIKQGTIGTAYNQIRPPMDPSRGFQLTNALYSDMNLAQPTV